MSPPPGSLITATQPGGGGGGGGGDTKARIDIQRVVGQESYMYSMCALVSSLQSLISDEAPLLLPRSQAR